MFKSRITNHPIHQDPDVQNKLEYYEKEMVPKMEQELVEKLNNKIEEALEASTRLYNSATRSPDSRRLFSIIRQNHLDKGRSFLEEQEKEENISDLKSEYIQAYHYNVTGRELYRKEFGEHFATPLFLVTSRALSRVVKDVEKPRVKFNEENLEEIREIPAIVGNRTYHSRRTNIETDEGKDSTTTKLPSNISSNR